MTQSEDGKVQCQDCTKMVRVKANGQPYKHKCNRDGHVETNIDVLSPSGFNTYKECEYKFWLVYGPRKLREPATKYTMRGVLVHKVAELLNDWKPSGNRATWKVEMMQEAMRLFEERWGRYKSLHKEPTAFKDETRVMVRNHVNQMAQHFEGNMIKMPDFSLPGIFTMSKPSAEERYNLVLSHKLRGTADEIYDFQEQDEKVAEWMGVVEKGDEATFIVNHYLAPRNEMEDMLIADLKTSKIFKIAWSPDYERQLLFYAMLHWLKYGKAPEYGSIKWLLYGKESYTRFSIEDIEALYEEVKALQEKARDNYDNEEAWNPDTKAKFCAWCWHGKQGYCQAGYQAHHAEDDEAEDE